jgi:ankyrin repeat protein
MFSSAEKKTGDRSSLIAMGVPAEELERAEVDPKRLPKLKTLIERLEKYTPPFKAQDLSRHGIRALTGNVDKLPPLDPKTEFSKQIVCYLALSGNTVALDRLKETIELIYINNVKPNADGTPSTVDKHSIDDKQRNLAHYAILSGDVAMIQYIAQTFPELITKTDIRGNSIAHYATDTVVNQEIINFLLAQPADVFQKIWQKNGRQAMPKIDPLTAQLETAEQHLRENQETDADVNLLMAYRASGIARIAAESGNNNRVQWLADKHPTLLQKPDEKGQNIFHHACISGNTALINDLLKNHPMLVKQLWIPDKQGSMPDQLSPEDNKFKFDTLLQQSLQKARENIRENNATMADVDLLISFNNSEIDSGGQTIAHYAAKTAQKSIIKHLLKEAPALMRQLWIRDKRGRLPHDCTPEKNKQKRRAILNKFLDKATQKITNDGELTTSDMALLFAFKTEWGELQAQKKDAPTRLRQLQFETLTREKLVQALLLARSSKNSRLLSRLEEFVKKLSESSLSPEQEKCLKVILNDHKKNRLGYRDQETKLLVEELESKLAKNIQNDILPIPNQYNFAEHLKNFMKLTEPLKLSIWQKDDLKKTIFPGLQEFINQETQNTIVQLIEKYKDKTDTLYYLSANMPLHIKNFAIFKTNADKLKAMQGVLTAFFTAVQDASELGVLDKFCADLCGIGCFEKRTEKAYKSLYELKQPTHSLQDLTDRYLEDEYVPYASHMGTADYDYIQPAADFIMKRHGGQKCEIGPFAPNGRIERSGIEAYLKGEPHTYKLPGTPHKYKPILDEIDAHILKLQRDKEKIRHYFSRNLKQTKIDVLKELHEEILEENTPAPAAATRLKQRYTKASSGFFSTKTKDILDKVEKGIPNQPKS